MAIFLKSGLALFPYKYYGVFQQINTDLELAGNILSIVICVFLKHTFYLVKFPSTIDENSRKKIKSVEKVENKRRDRLHIIAEILTITKDGSLKTQIMYKANLSFAQLNEYLTFLEQIELISLNKENNKTVYKTTDKGQNYLEKYKGISEILGNDDL